MPLDAALTSRYSSCSCARVGTPVEGRANRTLIQVLADELRLPKSRIKILSGARTRVKTIGIHDLSGAELGGLLEALVESL